MTHDARRWLFALVALAAGATAVSAEDCKREDFPKAVDQAGAQLRKFNLENQPKLNAKLEALRAKKGWKKTDSEDKALEYLQDGRISELDAQSNELLTKIDSLGRAEEGKAPDCAKLSELKASGVELLAVMKAKSAYTLEKIDLEIQGGSGGSAAAKTEPAQPTAPQTVDDKAAEVKIIAKVPEGKAPGPKGPDSKVGDKQVDAKAAEAKAAERKAAEAKAAERKAAEVKREPAATAGKPTETAPEVKPLTPKESAEARSDVERKGTQVPTSSWETSSRQAMNADPANRGDGRAGGGYEPGGAGTPYGPPPPEVTDAEEGYTIDEIREATRGFFGTISTNLASVIEYSFSKSGRPTAYILGQEGGGAFLAGLRYGDGTLYRRSGGTQTQKVYWHGPSVGYDVGAEGSRTLFLIYKLEEPEQLYRAFTGIDGSAYVVGGVGLTLLKGGPVVMAPIRSGIGLRLGANLGYVRFTPQATWNPF